MAHNESSGMMCKNLVLYLHGAELTRDNKNEGNIPAFALRSAPLSLRSVKLPSKSDTTQIPIGKDYDESLGMERLPQDMHRLPAERAPFKQS